MVLLKHYTFDVISFVKKFTFHYGSSQTGIVSGNACLQPPFTFHYGSSQTGGCYSDWFGGRYRLLIYIPLWFFSNPLIPHPSIIPPFRPHFCRPPFPIQLLEHHLLTICIKIFSNPLLFLRLSIPQYFYTNRGRQN